MSRRVQQGILLLIFGGLIALGAGAGVRLAMTAALSNVDCMSNVEACRGIASSLSQYQNALLTGGVVSMGAAGVATYLQNRVTNIEVTEGVEQS